MTDISVDDLDIEAIFQAANRRKRIDMHDEDLNFQDPDDLLGRMAAYQQKSQFNVGDLVTWKSGLRNRYQPSFGQPAVVMAVFPARLCEHLVHNVIQSFVPVDMEIGIVDTDDEFMVYAVDSQRFQLWTGDQP